MERKTLKVGRNMIAKNIAQKSFSTMKTIIPLYTVTAVSTFKHHPKRWFMIP